MAQVEITNATWELIQPRVNDEAEFLEIVHDFGDPLEIIREAISNSIDAHATWIKITFSVQNVDGSPRLVIDLADDGDGMTREALTRDFWGLGYSLSRERKENGSETDTIGEKGHGTKIYLRSERVIVRTQSKEGAYLSECEKPMGQLSQRKMHKPRLKPIEKFQPHNGTEISIIGYNNNERSRFVLNNVKDYILWFTKVGSIEQIFDIKKLSDFRVILKCLDHNESVEIPFGHVFPNHSLSIERLFAEKGPVAADWYVKRYVWKGERLAQHPEVTFDAVVSVEGDAVKKSYNPMIGERKSGSGRYRVADRYGIWLCKDYIPITRVNQWIPSFGSGSNAFVLLHGFINCQSLKLTANRGDIANTDPLILDELKTSIQKLIDKVDAETQEIHTLKLWQEEDRTLEQEKNSFSSRIKNLKTRKFAKLEDRHLIEPRQEQEVFGLFMTIYTLHPELFDFEPLDYSINNGIDVIAGNKTDNKVTENDHWYLELKHTLQRKKFNHAFKYLRWILCWDFDKDVVAGTELRGVEESDIRVLKAGSKNGHTVYFLDSPREATKIQVIRLKEYLKERLNLDFTANV